MATAVDLRMAKPAGGPVGRPRRLISLKPPQSSCRFKAGKLLRVGPPGQVTGPDDLDDRAVIHLATDLAEGVFQELCHFIGAAVRGAEDQGFLGTVRVDLLSQFSSHSAVEALCGHLAVEILNFQVDVARGLIQYGGVHTRRVRLGLLATLPVDPLALSSPLIRIGGS